MVGLLVKSFLDSVLHCSSVSTARWVVNAHDHLLAAEQRVPDELAGAQRDLGVAHLVDCDLSV